ncbi:MAG: response regulator transcription factor, partial [Pseudomonadota bacterium]
MAQQKNIILFIDDDEGLQVVVSEYLSDSGYKVIGATSGAEAKAAVEQNDKIDVVLLDLMLPDVEGFSLLPELTKTNAPIIILSGKSDTTEKIVGLEMGADDYMTKPFEMRELSARIKAVIRRSAKSDDAENIRESAAPAKEIIDFGRFYLDTTQYQVFDSQKKSLDFTTGEFKLLEALALSPNRVLTREHLFDITREGKFDVYDRAIDIQIARIRKKLAKANQDQSIIKTV